MQVVAVDEVQAQRAGDAGPDGRLARARDAHDDDSQAALRLASIALSSQRRVALLADRF
jgi:hypothetical protein